MNSRLAYFSSSALLVARLRRSIAAAAALMAAGCLACCACEAAEPLGPAAGTEAGALVLRYKRSEMTSPMQRPTTNAVVSALVRCCASTILPLPVESSSTLTDCIFFEQT